MKEPTSIAELVPVNGWLSEWDAYSGVSMMAPREFRMGLGLAVISAAVGKGVWFPAFERDRWHPHIWICLVGPAGHRKSTPVYAAKQFIKAVRGPEVLLPRYWSREGLGGPLSEAPDGLWEMGELQAFLKLAGRDYMGGAKEWLCDVWDGDGDAVARALKNKKDSTQAVPDLAMTAIATARPSDFEEAAGWTDFSSGFFSRFILFPTEAEPEYRGRRMPEGHDRESHAAERVHLLKGLAEIAIWHGGDHEVQIDEEADALWELYDKPWQKEAADVPPELSGWATRRGIQALKLAVLHGLSRTHKPIVEPEDVAFGVTVVQATWASVCKIAGDRVGLGLEGARVERVLAVGRQLSKKGHALVPEREWLRLCWRSLKGKGREFEDLLTMWEAAGMLERVKGRTSERGRQAKQVRFLSLNGAESRQQASTSVDDFQEVTVNHDR